MATHLGVQVQPGGAVDGQPLTIQPVIAALDGANAVVTSFGGAITAAVSSGPGIVTGGATVTAASGLGAYTGLKLALTGAPGLVTVTFSSGALTITSATFFLNAAGGVALVTTPTRVTTPARVGRVGDALDFTETLKGYDGKAQDLTGATVAFSLDGPDGVPIVSNAPATILNAAGGQVTYRVPATTMVPQGVSKWRYRATWDAATKLSFPDDADGTLTMMADLP